MQVLTALADFLAAGGNVTVGLAVLIFSGLLIAIIWLLNDRKRILSALKNRDKRIEEYIQKFENSQISVTKALSGIRELLIELRAIIKNK